MLYTKSVRDLSDPEAEVRRQSADRIYLFVVCRTVSCKDSEADDAIMQSYIGKLLLRQHPVPYLFLANDLVVGRTALELVLCRLSV